MISSLLAAKRESFHLSLCLSGLLLPIGAVSLATLKLLFESHLFYQFLDCEISGSHGGECKDACLLVRCAVQSQRI
jgi:hypothetical protein